MTGPVPRRALLAAAAAALLAGPAAAQDRSPTGRHEPPPPPAAAAAAGAGRWFLVLGAGLADGGDLVRVETVDGLPYTWDPDQGGGFRTDRFRTVLEPGPAAALGLGGRLGDRLSLRADLAWARCDVAAEASLGQFGAVYTFDRFSVLTAALGLEVRLAGGASHPYAGLGACLVRLDPDAAAGLAQTNLGGRLALGYRHPLDRVLGLRLEAWAARTGFTAGTWRPTTEAGGQPEVAVTGADGLTTYGIVLALTATLDP